MDLNRTIVENTLRSFLAEDLGYGDITSNLLITSEQKGVGEVVCRQNAVIAGIEEALVLLELADCRGTAKARDGDRVNAGNTILSAQGSARALLGVERTMLNLISHMSAVATMTADMVSIAMRETQGKVRITCTRKTLPGLRYFEKRAVELGGGDAHRLRLDDAVLIKDNHLELAGSVSDCVRKAKQKVSFTKKVEIELTAPDQVVEAAKAAADIILLDNMTPKEIERSVAILKSNNLRDKVLIEASGGIRKENLASYLRTGVDVISVGAITHSAPAIDVSMEIHSSRKRG